LSTYAPSAQRVLEDLRNKYPDTPFLALGQTVWWDEPMKAVLRRMLDDMGLGGMMLLGVHDTDYFAKVRVRRAGQSRFELMPHNDGTTKDLWSAAGEISRLFGSETFPQRHDYIRCGVGFNKAASCQPLDRQDFLNEVTEAWGWRGLVYTGSRDHIVHYLPLHDVGDAIEGMLRWGFEGAQESIVDHCCREEARLLGERMLEWVREYRAQNPDHMLSRLYQAIFPRLYELLLGAPPRNIDIICTAHLLRLTPETASLPRFEFVDLFLNEKTRATAVNAYNAAVAGSEIYTLDRFGLGALPFDVILPGHGRGTLRVTLRAIHIETRHPLRITLRQPINSVRELAEILTHEFGDHVTLVGKAVALISMLAREFIFVFNEEGSAYVSRTRRMNDILREAGVPLKMHPILRLRYRTWDSLEIGHATLSLPDHLATTFGQRQIPAPDFARRWSEVLEQQEQLLEEIRRIARPRDLLQFLARREGDSWTERLTQYNEAKRVLRDLRREGEAIQAQVHALYRELARVKGAIRDTEREKGDHFRATTDWTPAQEAQRAEYDRRIQALLSERRELLLRIQALKARRKQIERGPLAEPAREQIAQIEGAAELARLRLVRNAILARTGLLHTQHRPTAWWLPMVDPSGQWFRRIAETTEMYIEPVLSAE
jgi:hypothetical protein